MKSIFISILLFFFLPYSGYTQFVDDFSDGDLSGWEGDLTDFVVNAGNELQLNAPVGHSHSTLLTNIIFQDSMQWDLSFRLEFAPSTSNQLRIYLAADSIVPSNATSYFLEIGDTGSSDALEFHYAVEGVETYVAGSIPGLVASDPVDMDLRVTRNSQGLWSFYQVLGQEAELLFSVNHDLSPLTTFHFFGFELNYTDTRRDKFFFDDILIDRMKNDEQAPTWTMISVQDSNSLLLEFDEEIMPVSDGVNFVLIPGNLPADTVFVNGAQVILSWINSFIPFQPYTLMIDSISDLNGNILSGASRDFSYTLTGAAGEHEILMTEIMPDPNPVIGLPDAEYIELYNNSVRVFNLADYLLTVGSSERHFPDSLLFPGEYVLLTDHEDANLFTDFGRVISIDNMPSLTNSGATLLLSDGSGNLIHSISYNDTWYGDPQKSEGGWSLEMVNPYHICASETNWSASEHLAGGTPGRQNAEWSLARDTSGPVFRKLYVADQQTIELHFDESLDGILSIDPAYFTIEPVIEVANVILSDKAIIRLQLAGPLEAGVQYHLLPFIVFDCIGNPSSAGDTLLFGVPSDPMPGDVLINEILFNPVSGGSRFIEVINQSEKFISLETFAIARLREGNQVIHATGLAELLNPGEIAAFASDRNDILLRYQVPKPSKLFEVTLPSWDEFSDQVTILSGGMILDSFTYSSSWHHPILTDVNGVSLERVSGIEGASSAFNWHSASSVAGFATPTGQNSQHLAAIPEGIIPFTVINSTFSPDNDGFKDFLGIQFEPESGNDVASIWIYDLEGREISQVLSNEILGTGTLVQWDGRDDSWGIAAMGIYLIYIRIWHPDGSVREYKETCALVKR